MKHFLYLLVFAFIFTSCENEHSEVAPSAADHTIASQDFAEIARLNMQNTASQQKYISRQNQLLALSENERSKALDPSSNASEIVDDVFKSYNNIGNQFYRSGNYNFALLFYLTSVELKLQGSNNESLALTYRNIGLAYEALGDFENAAINLWQSYLLYQSLGNASKTATLLNDLGAVYDLAHDFLPLVQFQVDNSMALGFYTQAMDLSESLGEEARIDQVQKNIGMLFETYSERANLVNARSGDLKVRRDQDDVEDEL